MFTVGLVHARDHDLGCSIAGVTEPAARPIGGGFYIMSIQEFNRR